MKYTLTLQDKETHIVTQPRIDMIKWGRRKSEPSLIATTREKTTNTQCFITVPCSMIKSLIEIK
jgi:hypothetical protein